jgi:hypothetical protein
MGNNRNTVLIVAFVLAVYFFGKKSAGGAGDILGGCTTGILTNDQCRTIGLKLRGIMSEWYLDDSDENIVVDLFSRIQTECDYQRVHKVFGILNSTMFGDVDLDSYMKQRISEDNLAKCRVDGSTF